MWPKGCGIKVLDIITFVLAVIFGLNLLISENRNATNREIVYATAFLTCVIALFN